MSFMMLKSRLALEAFNGMVSRSVVKQGTEIPKIPKVPKPAKIKLPKPKPEGYKPPTASDPDRDPETGGYREGTKRNWKTGWHIKLEGDWEPYRPDTNEVFIEGEGWKDADKHAESLGISLAEPKKPTDNKKPSEKKKTGVSSDIARLKEDLEGNKISMDQAKTESRALMQKMGDKFREVQEKASDPESKKKLLGIAKKAQEFADKRKEALNSDNRKLMAEAMGLFDSVSEALGEASESLSGEKKEKSGMREFVYEKAALSTAPWEGKISDIEKAVGTKTKARTFVSGEGNLSGVFFDETEGGVKVAYKPEGFGDSPSSKRATLRAGPTSADREVAAFALDRLFGFGVVPPTFHRDSEVSVEDKRSFIRETGKKVNLDSDESEGSAQLFVKGESLGKEGKSISSLYDGMKDSAKFDVQKMAVFDYLVGNTDRHQGNIMVDGDHVYAIDNGLAFPEKGNLGQFKSVAMRAIQLRGGKVDNRIIDQLKKVDQNTLKSVMKDQGLSEEADGVLERLNNVIKSGGDLSGDEFASRR